MHEPLWCIINKPTLGSSGHLRIRLPGECVGPPWSWPPQLPRLRNDLLCVEWDVKSYTLIPSQLHRSRTATAFGIKPWHHRLNLTFDRHRRTVVVNKRSEHRIIETGHGINRRVGNGVQILAQLKPTSAGRRQTRQTDAKLGAEACLQRPAISLSAGHRPWNWPMRGHWSEMKSSGEDSYKKTRCTRSCKSGQVSCRACNRITAFLQFV